MAARVGLPPERGRDLDEHASVSQLWPLSNGAMSITQQAGDQGHRPSGTPMLILPLGEPLVVSRASPAHTDTYYTSIRVNSWFPKAGSFVLILTENSRRFVGLVLSLFERRLNSPKLEKEALAECIILKRPEDTTLSRKPFHGAAELLVTNEHADVPLRNVVGLCSVEHRDTFQRRTTFPEGAFYVTWRIDTFGKVEEVGKDWPHGAAKSERLASLLFAQSAERKSAGEAPDSQESVVVASPPQADQDGASPPLTTRRRASPTRDPYPNGDGDEAGSIAPTALASSALLSRVQDTQTKRDASALIPKKGVTVPRTPAAAAASARAASPAPMKAKERDTDDGPAAIDTAEAARSEPRGEGRVPVSEESNSPLVVKTVAAQSPPKRAFPALSATGAHFGAPHALSSAQPRHVKAESALKQESIAKSLARPALVSPPPAAAPKRPEEDLVVRGSPTRTKLKGGKQTRLDFVTVVSSQPDSNADDFVATPPKETSHKEALGGRASKEADRAAKRRSERTSPQRTDADRREQAKRNKKEQAAALDDIPDVIDYTPVKETAPAHAVNSNSKAAKKPSPDKLDAKHARPADTDALLARELEKSEHWVKEERRRTTAAAAAATPTKTSPTATKPAPKFPHVPPMKSKSGAVASAQVIDLEDMVMLEESPFAAGPVLAAYTKPPSRPGSPPPEVTPADLEQAVAESPSKRTRLKKKSETPIQERLRLNRDTLKTGLQQRAIADSDSESSVAEVAVKSKSKSNRPAKRLDLDDLDEMGDFIQPNSERVETYDNEGKPVTGSEDVLAYSASQLVGVNSMSYRDAFTIYVQFILSTLVNADFPAALQADDAAKAYFLPPKTKIEQRLRGLQDNLVVSTAWAVEFVTLLKSYPIMRSVGNTSNKINCQACNRAQHPSAVELQLMGTQYDSEALWDNDDYASVEEPPPMDEFYTERHSSYLGKNCASRARVAHRLQHYKYELVSKLRLHLEQQMPPHATEEEKVVMIQDLMRDSRWIKPFYMEYEVLCAASLEDYAREG